MEHDNVNHPQHYTEGFEMRSLECIDITRHLPFALGNAVKYIWRAGLKGGKDKALEDLNKAEWYMREWSESHWDSYNANTPLALLMTAVPPPCDNRVQREKYDALLDLLGGRFNDCLLHLHRMRKAITNEN